MNELVSGKPGRRAIELSRACAAVCVRCCARRWTPRCRRCARPAASHWATAWACAPPAGRNSPSSSRRFARGSAFPLPTIPAPACCRWKRSPRRRPTTSRARRCATTKSPARWCWRSNTATGLISRRMMGRWMARAGHELLTRRRRAAAGAAALAADYGRAASISRRLWRAAIARDLRRAGAARRAQARARHPAAGRACPNPNAPTTCKAPSACRPTSKAQVAGRRLVLIDDVLTSGATVDTCARALLRAGAAHVDVLVFARVVAPVRSPI